MLFEFIFIAGTQNSRVTSSTRKRELHRLLEQLEALYLFHSLGRRFRTVEHDKSLSLGLQVALRDDVNNSSIFGEHSP